MDTEREADKKFIPMSGEIGNSKKDKNLGTAEAATNINAVPRAVGLFSSNQMDQVTGSGRQGSNKDGTTLVSSVMRRLGVDWDIKGRKSGGRKW